MKPKIKGKLTCRAHAKAKVDGIPDHGPVGDWEERLGTLIGIGREGRK